MRHFPVPPITRFLELFVIADDNCWNWTGATVDEYGNFYNGNTTEGAHRFSYKYFKGPIPAELEVDHLCNNRTCCNPDHLELVTPEENIRRRTEYGRAIRAERERMGLSPIISREEHREMSAILFANRRAGAQ